MQNINFGSRNRIEDSITKTLSGLEEQLSYVLREPLAFRCQRMLDGIDFEPNKCRLVGFVPPESARRGSLRNPIEYDLCVRISLGRYVDREFHFVGSRLRRRNSWSACTRERTRPAFTS